MDRLKKRFFTYLGLFGCMIYFVVKSGGAGADAIGSSLPFAVIFGVLGYAVDSLIQVVRKGR